MPTPEAQNEHAPIEEISETESANAAIVSNKPKKYKEKFKRKSDGELYELTVSVPHPLHGRTHKAVNEVHTWEGESLDFAHAFTKADGTPLLPSI